jgi:hypothetical protein
MSALQFVRGTANTKHPKEPTLYEQYVKPWAPKQKQQGGASFMSYPSSVLGAPLAIAALLVFSFLLSFITCSIRPGATYERFDTTLTTQVTQEDLTAKCAQATGLLQKDEALLDAAADKTCGIYKQISTSLVKNAAVPSDPLQPITQAEQTSLNAKAQAQFEKTKCSFMAKNNNQPLLDCFAGQEASQAETALKEAVLALDAQLNASKMKMKARGVQTTLAFTAPYVDEVVKAFSEGFYGCEGSADSQATAIQALTGPTLVAKGVALYNDAMKLHQEISKLPQVAKLQADLLAAVNAKKDNLERPGGPSEEETASFKKQGKTLQATSA